MELAMALKLTTLPFAAALAETARSATIAIRIIIEAAIVDMSVSVFVKWIRRELERMSGEI